MVVFGLLVNKPRVLEALYVYYRDRIFHRIAEPKNSGIKVTPEGHTVILVEMMCELSDDRWNMGRATLQQMVRDLEAENLLQGRDIVEVHLVRAEEAYPVFDLGFEAHQEVLSAQVEALENALSTGRQGAFCYPNMHTAMRMGADAAQVLIARRDAMMSAKGRQARNFRPLPFEDYSDPDKETAAMALVDLAGLVGDADSDLISDADAATLAAANGTMADALAVGPADAATHPVKRSTEFYMPDGDQRGATPAEELSLGATETKR
jgi:hypothetical protein